MDSTFMSTLIAIVFNHHVWFCYKIENLTILVVLFVWQKVFLWS